MQYKGKLSQEYENVYDVSGEGGKEGGREGGREREREGGEKLRFAVFANAVGAVHGVGEGHGVQ